MREGFEIPTFKMQDNLSRSWWNHPQGKQQHKFKLRSSLFFCISLIFLQAISPLKSSWLKCENLNAAQQPSLGDLFEPVSQALELWHWNTEVYMYSYNALQLEKHQPK